MSDPTPVYGVAVVYVEWSVSSDDPSLPDRVEESIDNAVRDWVDTAVDLIDVDTEGISATARMVPYRAQVE